MFGRSQSRLVEAWPPDWREHPELRDRYSAALRATTGGALKSLSRGVWFGVLLVGFLAVLWKGSVWAELIVMLGVAVIWTNAEVSRSVRETKALTRTLHLSAAASKHRTTTALRYASRLSMWCGYLATGAFAGGLLAQAIR